MVENNFTEDRMKIRQAVMLVAVLFIIFSLGNVFANTLQYPACFDGGQRRGAK
ncbi:MAG: hypothetical protein ACD_17C00032G0001 [uncultured bacterium]|nr:MAG: hypothetical protein ACD_17C00032G0001 [uncultured bacterium]